MSEARDRLEHASTLRVPDWASWIQSRAARVLGVHRNTLIARLALWGRRGDEGPRGLSVVEGEGTFGTMALVVFASWLLVMPSVATAQGTAQDFASFRKAADSVAAKTEPGFTQLWRIDLTLQDRGRPLHIRQAEFLYFQPQKLQLAAVVVQPEIGGGGSSGLSAHSEDSILFWGRVATGQLRPAPIPRGLRSPDEMVKRLNGQRSGRATFTLKLLQVGVAPAESRYAGALGIRQVDLPFFQDTAPAGKWIWWTILEQDRPAPDTNPRAPGLPQRAEEWIYIDALTGQAVSHCKGTGPKEIPCT